MASGKVLFLAFFVSLLLQSKSSGAQQWHALDSGLEYSANSFAVFNGKLVAGGDGVHSWNGQKWTDKSTGLKSFFGGEIYTIAISNSGILYCGGDGFHVLTPDQNLYNYAARWDGDKWTTVGSGTGNDGSGMSGSVHAMTSYNGILHAGGNFSSAGGDPLDPFAVYYAARFSGTSCCWQSIGTGVNDKVIEMLVDPVTNTLYAGGLFTEAGGQTANHIAKWNGSNWSALGTGLNGTVSAMCFHNGELYVGGSFSTAGGQSVENIARWNGTNWIPLSKGLGNSIYDLISYNGYLFAAGPGFYLNDTNQYVVKWDGANWTPLGAGVDKTAIKFFVYNNELLVGGIFKNAGNKPASCIAAFTLPPNGMDETNLKHKIALYPNPASSHLYFEQSGSVKIMNSQGQMLIDLPNYAANTAINISELTIGYYIVSIDQQGNFGYAKLLKQ
ncbi:MAG: T9SS type A sorting domain-containing protein [Bacteroidia bacterium]|jgi:hypothetical protein